MINPTQADSKYFENPVGITVLYRNQCNIVINDGIIGSVVCLKEDI